MNEISARLKNLKNIINITIGKKQQLQEKIETTSCKIKDIVIEIEDIDQAQRILQSIAKKTQQELEYHISELVSLALSAVFEDPYEFVLDFVEKRNRTEAEMFFIKKNGNRIDPLSESGGGAVDIASFALIVALWNLRRKLSRNTIILDEPFRFLSRELQPKAGRMLKELSHKLGIQFIIVTHNPDLIDAADKVFEVCLKNRVSIIQ